MKTHEITNLYKAFLQSDLPKKTRPNLLVSAAKDKKGNYKFIKWIKLNFKTPLTP